jgi:hypothetical protein
VEIPQNTNSALTYLEEDKDIKKVSKRARKANSTPLPVDWKPNESHTEAAAKMSIPKTAVDAKAEDMRLWAQSSGALKVDWDATFHGFLRRDREKLAAYGPAFDPAKLEDEKQQFLREIHDLNRRSKTGTSLQQGGAATHQENPNGRQGSTTSADHQTRHRGMVGLGAVLPRTIGVFACDDATDSERSGDGLHSTKPMARRF